MSSDALVVIFIEARDFVVRGWELHSQVATEINYPVMIKQFNSLPNDKILD